MTEKHRPPSHPVMRANLARAVQHDLDYARRVVAYAEEQSADTTELLEQIARKVARLSGAEFTVEQRRMAQTIVHELHRRSREQEARDHERYYAYSPNEEINRKYAAIAAAVQAEPRRRLREIASEFGVSTQLVSRVAISRNARRRLRSR